MKKVYLEFKDNIKVWIYDTDRWVKKNEIMNVNDIVDYIENKENIIYVNNIGKYRQCLNKVIESLKKENNNDNEFKDRLNNLKKQINNKKNIYSMWIFDLPKESNNKNNEGDKYYCITKIMSNMHYFFNKTYYDFLGEINSNINGSLKDISSSKDKKIIEENIRNNNKAIKEYKYNFEDNRFDALENFSNIIMSVEYPGLLIGIGNNHQTNLKGEIAMGFSFDYVTGLPYIPGSSLKGKLASAFKYTNYIIEQLPEIQKEVSKIEDKDDFVKKLSTNIFGDKDTPGTDIFIDSFVTDYKDKKILGLDNLAPHRQDKKLLTLGEVNIITMLRLKPGTKIKFNFLLRDSIIQFKGKKITISGTDKLELFKIILMDFGIGAKTNVGYGYLTEDKGD